MIWPRLAAKLLISAALLGGAAAGTLWRAQAREAAIAAEYPPEGAFLTVNGAQIVAQESPYPQLTLPVELIHGTADTIVPLAIHATPLASRLPNATLTVIDGAGHMPHYSHPTQVLAAIERAALRAGPQSP